MIVHKFLAFAINVYFLNLLCFWFFYNLMVKGYGVDPETAVNLSGGAFVIASVAYYLHLRNTTRRSIGRVIIEKFTIPVDEESK